MKIEFGYTYHSIDNGGKDLPVTWTTLLEEHNDQLNSAVSKEFQASIVFSNAKNIPDKFFIRAIVSDDDGHGSEWSKTISNTIPLFGLGFTEMTSKDNGQTALFIEQTTIPENITRLEAPMPSRSAMEDTFKKLGSFLYVKHHVSDECLLDHCKLTDIQFVMRINAVVALKHPCDPGVTNQRDCDIWMQIKIGTTRKEDGHKKQEWSTLLEEHDSVAHRQISRVFRASKSFKNKVQMWHIFALQVTVRDDDNREHVWSESFNITEPVLTYYAPFKYAHMREGIFTYKMHQIPFKARRRRSVVSRKLAHRFSSVGLPSREDLQRELDSNNTSFIKLFITNQQECIPDTVNRQYVQNCIEACHSEIGR